MQTRCLGLDNSRYSTGWSVVDINESELTIVDYGTIDTSKIKNEGQTLIYIEQQFTELFNQFHPDVIAAEQMFVGRNAQTGIMLASIHAIMKLVAAKNNCPIQYYSIMSAKSIVTGGLKLKKDDGSRKTGNELKLDVAQAVFHIFPKENFTNITDDVTDALSMVITYWKTGGKGIGKQSANVKSTRAKKKLNVEVNKESKSKVTNEKTSTSKKKRSS